MTSLPPQAARRQGAYRTLLLRMGEEEIKSRRSRNVCRPHTEIYAIATTRRIEKKGAHSLQLVAAHFRHCSCHAGRQLAVRLLAASFHQTFFARSSSRHIAGVSWPRVASPSLSCSAPRFSDRNPATTPFGPSSRSRATVDVPGPLCLVVHRPCLVNRLLICRTLSAGGIAMDSRFLKNASKHLLGLTFLIAAAAQPMLSQQVEPQNTQQVEFQKNWGLFVAPVYGTSESGAYAGAELFAGPNKFGSYFAGVLPNGAKVVPAGTVAQIGMNPLGAVLTPDGKYLITSNDDEREAGYPSFQSSINVGGYTLSVVDTASLTVVSQISS